MPLTRESDWGCVRMREVTIRKQKIKKDSVKFRLILFGTLAVLLIVCSIFSEYLTPCDPYLQDLSIAKQPPDAEHLLGTDRYGRDMLSRVIVGSRTSIFSTLLLVAIITALGTAVGVVCGWNGKALDTVLMRISDLFLAFPGLVFALAVAGVLGGGAPWPGPCRQAGVQGEAQRGLLLLQQGPGHRALPQLRLAGARRRPGKGHEIGLRLRHRRLAPPAGQVSEEREQEHLGGH